MITELKLDFPHHFFRLNASYPFLSADENSSVKNEKIPTIKFRRVTYICPWRKDESEFHACTDNHHQHWMSTSGCWCHIEVELMKFSTCRHDKIFCQWFASSIIGFFGPCKVKIDSDNTRRNIVLWYFFFATCRTHQQNFSSGQRRKKYIFCSRSGLQADDKCDIFIGIIWTIENKKYAENLILSMKLQRQQRESWNWFLNLQSDKPSQFIQKNPHICLMSIHTRQKKKKILEIIFEIHFYFERKENKLNAKVKPV